MAQMTQAEEEPHEDEVYVWHPQPPPGTVASPYHPSEQSQKP